MSVNSLHPSESPSRIASSSPTELASGSPSTKSPFSSGDEVNEDCRDAEFALEQTTRLADEAEFLQFQVEFLLLSDYCTTLLQPNNNQRCVVKYDDFVHNIKDECELAGGRYMEAFVTCACTDSDGDDTSSRPRDILEFAVSNEPHCIGMPCSEAETYEIVEKQFLVSVRRAMLTLEENYNNCSIRYSRVVQFINIFQRITAAPVPPPTDTPTTAPSPSPIVIPTPVPSKIPTELVPATQVLTLDVTFPPAPTRPTTVSEQYFNFRPSPPSSSSLEQEPAKEPQNPLFVIMIVVIVVLGLVIINLVWQRLSRPPQGTTNTPVGTSNNVLRAKVPSRAELLRETRELSSRGMLV